jgi:hypothetical protein
MNIQGEYSNLGPAFLSPSLGISFVRETQLNAGWNSKTRILVAKLPFT